MRIHLIAIGGSVMHSLAIALKKLGHEVSGSDDEIFEPSRSKLDKNGLLPQNIAWNAENITSDIDLVIVGMHAKEDNPELIRANKLGIKIQSYPEFILEHSKNKQRIVITGSHGKTTVTSMIMHVLSGLNYEFDYLVGAQVEGFEESIKISDSAPFIILEGDEYFSSPTNKIPKFKAYEPHVVVINGIAWDHVNLYPTEEAYQNAFRDLVKDLPKAAMVLYNTADKQVKKLVEENYREDDMLLYPYKAFSYKKLLDSSYEVKINKNSGKIQVFGKHNIENLAAAWEVCQLLSIREDEFLAQISTFKGAANRLEKIYEAEDVTIFKDFAHSPSKVRATVDAVIEKYGKKNLVVYLELHTFSSLNKEFLKQYKKALKAIKNKVVFVNESTLKLKKMLPITREEIIKAFDDKDIVFLKSREDLKNSLAKMRNNRKKTVLLMSSGNFANLDYKKLLVQ